MKKSKASTVFSVAEVVLAILVIALFIGFLAAFFIGGYFFSMLGMYTREYVIGFILLMVSAAVIVACVLTARACTIRSRKHKRVESKQL